MTNPDHPIFVLKYLVNTDILINKETVKKYKCKIFQAGFVDKKGLTQHVTKIHKENI